MRRLEEMLEAPVRWLDDRGLLELFLCILCGVMAISMVAFVVLGIGMAYWF